MVPPDAPDKFKQAVHLKDIHLEKGMHCVDCHFSQDNHGNGKLYGETRNAVEIDCGDCHGTIDARATLKTSACAAPQAAPTWRPCRRRSASAASAGRADDHRPALDGGAGQAVGGAPDHRHDHPGPRRATTSGRGWPRRCSKDGTTWGDVPEGGKDIAHPDAEDDLLHLPLLVGDVLLRLPPAA